MSGGSLNYLCYCQTNELFNRIGDLEEAEEYLLKCGYKDIARDVRRLIEYLLSAENRISTLFEQLSEVLHAIEWHMSADYGEDTAKKVLEQYRGTNVRTFHP